MANPSHPWTATREQLLGLSVDPLDRAQSLSACCALIESGSFCHHVVINAGKTVLAHEDPVLRSIINSADLVNADGQAVVWAGRTLGISIPERVTGIDLMHDLISAAEERKWPVYLLGATQEVLDAATQTFIHEHPRLLIAGTRNGYFDDDAAIARDISASGARLLFVAMPSPRKELFLHEQSAVLGPMLAFGVGGSFDVVAGKTRRAPRWMQSAGLEWLYRLLQEPRRMWKRYVYGNTRFIWLVLAEKLRRR